MKPWEYDYDNEHDKNGLKHKVEVAAVAAVWMNALREVCWFFSLTAQESSNYFINLFPSSPTVSHHILKSPINEKTAYEKVAGLLPSITKWPTQAHA